MALTIDQIVELFETRGGEWYGGEGVTQTAHALQCADLAEKDGSPTSLVVACLLHDLGHLLTDLEPDPAVDDVHQFVALPFLRGVFPASVLQPIRLHVDAKRYLCAIDAGYVKGLSSTSRASLALQGGVLGAREAARFIEQPFSRDAIRLRQFDDLAKIPGKPTPPLGHYVGLLASLDRLTLRS